LRVEGLGVRVDLEGDEGDAPPILERLIEQAGIVLHPSKSDWPITSLFVLEQGFQYKLNVHLRLHYFMTRPTLLGQS
jgi:hypothetical protein